MRAQFLLLFQFSSFLLQAQQIDTSFILTSAGKHFEAGPIFRFFFGTHWRETWSQQVSVPRLSLGDSMTVEPTQEIGHVVSLVLRNANGMRFLVRPVERDVRYMLPEELRETVAREIIEDQISVANPYATLVTAKLERALGLRANLLTLVALGRAAVPDTLPPSLTNVPASFEQLPTRFDRWISTDSLFLRLALHSEETVDEIAYLKQRLLDLLVGEWDRSPAEWRWRESRSDDRISWFPEPSPRDRAFSRFDGLFPSLAQLGVPRFSHVDESYGDIGSLTTTARALDRRILISNEKQTWDSIAAWMKSAISDSVIATAVRSLPAPVFQREGAALALVLKSRRNQIESAAKEFYKLCSEFVEIQSSPKGETIRAQKVGGHLVFLERWTRESKPRKIFSRRFTDDYTREIRLFLSDSGNLVLLDGADESAIRIRIVAGNADSVRESVPTRMGQSLNPFRTAATFVYGEPAAKVGRHTKTISTLPTMEGTPESDYGSAWKFVPWVGSSPDEGFFLGGGIKYEEYGFRLFPYELSHQVRLGMATLPGKFRADWTGEFYAPLDPAKLTLHALASQVEVQNFFGIGNESRYNEALDRARFYKVEQNQFVFRATVDTKIEASTRMLIGGGFKIVDNSLLPNSLIDSLEPYGSARNFSLANVGVQFFHDSRNDRLFPSAGWYGIAELGYYPEWFTNQHSFIRLKAELRSYVPLASGILALRGLAESISDTHPFFESAFLGGPASLRGYEVQRFTGDAAVFGGGEFRLPAAQYIFLVPQWFGVSVFAETGRVFADGENSSAIHSTIGAGVWFSFIKREYVGAFSVARSKEKLFFYGTLGFAF
jgi:hypothetical protein